MIGYRNPVAFVREVIANVRGLKVEEEWRVYLVVACLSIVCSAIILLHVVLGETTYEPVSQSTQQHIKLQMDAKLFQQKPPERTAVVKEAAKPVVKQVEQAVPKQEPVKKAEVKERVASGEWSYDEARKEWRYMKK
ncbi:hypothetical protein [Anaerosinus massiliensis]|uniref:hypothetical protein n=1 Tax=Massilibacillus massiliensis TaxID=1806837 RepID=UPI000DA61440|nr:hypothetical protein [Massilibacillus massiliensis]